MATGTGTAPRRRTTSTRKPPAETPAAVVLPPSTPAKFEDLLNLMDQVVGENVDVFLERAQEYRQKHRDGTDRPLTAQEAVNLATAAITAAVGDETVVELSARYQQSDLRAHDEATPAEFLLAGGIATAPKFLDAVLRFVALVELPCEEHERLYDTPGLDDEIAARVKQLKFLDLKDARARAAAALEHFSAEAGVGAGKGLGALARTALQVITEAMGHLTTKDLVESASTSLISSDARTDGRSESADSD